MDLQPDPLLQARNRTNTVICLADPPLEARGYFEPDRQHIVLRSDLSRGVLLAILVHELRHMEQISRGFCPSPVLDMKEAARLQLAMEADAQAVATLYAWGLSRKGHPDAWDALRTLEHYSDITRSFERAMTQGGDLGVATAAAFAQWYQSEWRTEAYYVSSCASHLDRLDQEKRPPGYDRIPPGFLAHLCRLPSGGRYECEAATRFDR